MRLPKKPARFSDISFSIRPRVESGASGIVKIRSKDSAEALAVLLLDVIPFTSTVCLYFKILFKFGTLIKNEVNVLLFVYFSCQYT